MKKNNKIISVFISFLILLVVLMAGGYIYYQDSIAAVSKESKLISFEVKQGESAYKVLHNLRISGLIKNETTAKLYLKLNSHLGDIKKGVYELDASWNLDMILTHLNDGRSALNDDVTITFVEGDWAKHYAEKISEATNLTYDEIISYWNDETAIRTLMPEYPFLTEELFNENIRIKLEGYLFPETYQFHRETTVEEVTRRLLNQTNSVYRELKKAVEHSTLQTQLTTHQLFTLASIVQYEASKVEDMKMVAGVFDNRLAQNWLLQSSVTVCYAIDKTKEDDWTKCEVNPDFESLYNTYKYAGLPPGPILNPGYDALLATLQPTKSDYMFFMADVYGDGTVYYSKTLEEHQAYVNKYLR